MSVSLVKGQKVNLVKNNNESLNVMTVGLGWDIKTTGLFDRGSSNNYDLDASIIVCRDGKYSGQKGKDLVYFGNTKVYNGAIVHCGDNLTGEGDGDDEQIIINLKNLPSDVDKLVIAVNIYSAKSRKQDFGQVQNAFVRICDNSGVELYKFNLTDNYSGCIGMIFGEIYRYGDGWKFNPIGEGVKEDTIERIADKYK